MWGGIRAEKEAGQTTGCGRDQGPSMALPLHNREAVEVAAKAADEHRVAIEMQMMESLL